MRLWRICRKPFSKKPLDGRGGLVVAGRWHTPRRWVTYASESLALASLEVLVHVDLDLLPVDLVAIEILIPSGLRVAQMKVDDLPRSWRKYPAPSALQRLGNAWLDGASTAVLRVPSAVVPTESKYLLNPLHADADKFKLLRRLPFGFDARLRVH